MVLVPNPLTKVCTSYNQTTKCIRVHLTDQNLAVQRSLTQTHILKCACASAHTRTRTRTHTHTHTHTHNIYPCSNIWAHTQTQTNLVKYTNENVAVLGQLGHNRIMDYNTYAYVLVLVADILCRANYSIL